jgi:hypothetical protein
VSLGEAIRQIEARRESRVLVMAASNLDLELLPSLYETLTTLERPPRLDVLLYCRGGEVSAARRIALLLDSFTEHLAFIVPHHCQSAGTVITLIGREVIAGPLAMFSPIDPHLQADGEGEIRAISAEDVRLFGEMAQAWFGLEPPAARRQALDVLAQSIFPTTLTSFYRLVLEARLVALDLLGRHMPQSAETVAERLLFGWHSHGFSVTGEDLAAIGLPVRRDAGLDEAAWTIARDLAMLACGGTRTTPEAPWYDALIATRDGGTRRRRAAGPAHPTWEPLQPC